jgi:rRNA small subunit pseudouridine methyltransferase Nep1
MLVLIVAESELELVPPPIQDHPSIRRYAQRRNKSPSEILLDSNYHHSAMRLLPEADRRGRPDIVHLTLLLALDTPLNRKKLLKTYIHTRNDEVIHINPTTRLPRNYGRFVGLMEQLFKEGRVPPKGEPLLRLERKTLKELVDELGTWNILLSERGDPEPPLKLMRECLDRRTAIIVGGFPHGDFKQANDDIVDKRISIYPEPLCTWTATARMLFAYEDALHLNSSRKQR